MQRLPTRDIVLVGAGHTNLHVVRQWIESPVADCRLTVVSATPFATYSGMLPGSLAGLYQPDDMLIDLQRLTRAVGARLIIDAATRLDPERRRIYFDRRPPIRFDVASVGSGSVPAGMSCGRGHSGLVAVKPMFTFLSRLEDVVRRIDSNPIRIVVVGSGAAGVEIAFCIRRYFDRCGRSTQIRLVEAGDEILPGFRSKTIQVTRRELAARDIEVLTKHRVVKCDAQQISFENGQSTESDLLLWCVGAAPGDFPKQCGLPLTNDGFISIEPTLQCTSRHPVFAVGDVAQVPDQPLPRAGVYAVRQGPILLENLHRFFDRQSLVAYEPQSDFLRLLATGDGAAIGQYYGLAGCHRLLWNLKNRIDSRFMDMHRPEKNPMLSMNNGMPQPATPKEPAAAMEPMRCAGCGGKTSPRVLADVLRELRDAPRATHHADFLQFGDAAILSAATGPVDAVSVDFFEAFLDDPWLIGRIAAVHALSDLWASGTTATAAVAMVTLPAGQQSQQRQVLEHLLAGAVQEFEQAGVVLVGGHTVDGDSLSVGFTVLGRTGGRTPFSKSGLKPAQRLLLTKPLGTGVILAAAMRNETSVRSTDAAIRMMLRSNQAAADVAQEFGLTSVTDVTGFGLAGHLFEMLDASDVSAKIDPASIPLLPGAADCISRGVRSSLDPENRHLQHRITVAATALRSTPVWHAMFDPQTSGGLILGVDADRTDDVLERLRACGHDQACVIGEVTSHDEPSEPRDAVTPQFVFHVRPIFE